MLGFLVRFPRNPLSNEHKGLKSKSMILNLNELKRISLTLSKNNPASREIIYDFTEIVCTRLSKLRCYGYCGTQVDLTASPHHLNIKTKYWNLIIYFTFFNWPTFHHIICTNSTDLFHPLWNYSRPILSHHLPGLCCGISQSW